MKVLQAASKAMGHRVRLRAAVASVAMAIVMLSWHPSFQHALADGDSPARWEPSIAAFEEDDRKHGPRKGGILFVGSSSIRAWNTDRDFPDHGVINRGFGGSQMSDVLHYYDRIVAPYEPKCMVLYEGDNDIAKGKRATDVARDFEQLAERFHAQFPQSKLWFISIKPSLSRWRLYPEMKKANDLVADYCAKQKPEFCGIIDVSRVMLGESGKPIEQLFVDDGLHLNRAGYDRWTKLVMPKLPEQ